MFDPLRFAAALLPLASYFVVIGALRLRQNPTVISRSLDFLMLGMACIGLIAIGPMELFFPRAAYSVVGNWVWLVLLCLYSLIVLLIAFHVPPGIVVYGIHKEPLKLTVDDLLNEMGLEHEWLEDVLRIRSKEIQAQMEEAGWNGVCILSAVGKQQNLYNWLELDRELHKKLQNAKAVGHGSGLAIIALGMAILFVAIGLLMLDMERLNETISMFFD